MSHTCATCRHYVPENDQPRDVPDFGRCYRYPESRSAGVEHWCGEHAPRPDEAGPGLPAGWEWHDATDGAAAVCSALPDRYVFAYPIGVVDAFSAPPEVIEAVLARHRARVGGAS